MSEKLKVEKTRTGNPALWVGGGATTSKFSARFVMRAGKLPPPLFIRTRGHRCNGDQVLVAVKAGDIIIDIAGRLPATPDNPDVSFTARRIVGFGTDDTGQAIALCECVDIPVDAIPPSVWQGVSIYHNREGMFFVSE